MPELSQYYRSWDSRGTGRDSKEGDGLLFKWKWLTGTGPRKRLVSYAHPGIGQLSLQVELKKDRKRRFYYYEVRVQEIISETLTGSRFEAQQTAERMLRDVKDKLIKIQVILV